MTKLSTIARYAVVGTVLLMIAGCGGSDSKPGSAKVGGNDSGSLGPPTTLTLTYSSGKGGKVEPARLTCTKDQGSSGTGYLAKNAEATCGQIDSISRLLIQGPDPNKACTQVYGGPQTLKVSGRVAYETVDRTFKRTNGCQIADWKTLEPLLPADAPA